MLIMLRSLKFWFVFSIFVWLFVFEKKEDLPLKTSWRVWEAIEHCVSFKLRCISMFDTLMLCWTTSPSSSHFLASRFLWIGKCRASFLEWKMSGYNQTNLVLDTDISIWLRVFRDGVAKRPIFCKIQVDRVVGRLDGWTAVLVWLNGSHWTGGKIRW